MTGDDCSQPPDGVADDHVAGRIDDVEVHGVAARAAQPADGRFADAGSRRAGALARRA